MVTFMARKYWRMEATIKLGTETPTRAMSIQTVSMGDPRLIAATVPNTTPMIKANRMARMPTSKETTKLSAITVVTSRLFCKETPKSPWRQLPI